MDLSEFNIQLLSQIKRHPWELTRYKMLNYFVKPFKKKRILDVGSGDAYLSRNLALQYPKSNIVALDINYDEESIKCVNNSNPTNLLLTSNIEQAKIMLGGEADIVLLLDVLEHVLEPNILLESICRSYIDKDTLFVITVPSFQFLYSEHDRKLGHVKRYNLKSLKQLLANNNFNIYNCGYAFNSLVIIRLLQLWIEKITGNKKTTQNGIHNWKANKLITNLLTFVFWIEFKISWYLSLLGIKVPGLTCYCVCRYSPL